MEDQQPKQLPATVVVTAAVHSRKWIRCNHCYRLRFDPPHRFRTKDELAWFRVIDATGWCATCDQYCNPCSETTNDNPGRKLMFCNPLCWIQYRNGVSGMSKKNKEQLLSWCDLHLTFPENIKRLIKQAFRLHPVEIPCEH